VPRPSGSEAASELGGKGRFDTCKDNGTMDLLVALARAEDIWRGEFMRAFALSLTRREISRLVSVAADLGVTTGDFRDRRNYLAYVRRGNHRPTDIDIVVQHLESVCVGDTDINSDPGLRRVNDVLTGFTNNSQRFAELASYHNVSRRTGAALCEDLELLVDSRGQPLPWVQQALADGELGDFAYVLDGLEHVASSVAEFETLFRGLERSTTNPPRASSYVVPAISWRPVQPLIRLAKATDALIAEVARYPAAVHKLTGRQFELLLRDIFEGFGFTVDLTSQTRDGGVDLLCLSTNYDIPVRIAIEAKRYAPHRPVSVDLVRSFVGANAQWHANKLIYVTTSRFTRDAVRYASAVETNLLMLADLPQIVRWANLYFES
jgi:hypothetical protein